VVSFDIDQIDDVVHGRLRLGVLAYLAANETADFNELKDVLKATQGNLSVHLRKLEEAGYVRIQKGFLGRKPRTRVQMTAQGRRALASYLESMSRLIAKARE
jgi:DNA-binding MarR family transcriptional regulator